MIVGAAILPQLTDRPSGEGQPPLRRQTGPALPVQTGDEMGRILGYTLSTKGCLFSSAQGLLTKTLMPEVAAFFNFLVRNPG